MSEPARVRVLIVEDENVAAAAHAEYVKRMPQFEVVGVARTAQQALTALNAAPTSVADFRIDLVLLDMNLPDMHGLELCRQLRSQGVSVDVIAVTAARDLRLVQEAISVGVVQYLIKPFTFPAFRAKLESYLEYRRSLPVGDEVTQSDLDKAFAALRSPEPSVLPKGLQQLTLDSMVEALRESGPVSATELAKRVGVSRVTARRYLESLADSGQAVRRPRYGTVGRPELEYEWIRTGDSLQP